MINLKEGLRNVLLGKLPGEAVQLLMAPEFRKEEIQARDLSVPIKKSAVLVLFNPFAEQLSLIITKRSVKLKVHRGQVSFPGGRMDDSDANSTDTALRETWEEIGIPIQQIQVLGQLSNLFIPPTNFLVVPIVGVLTQKPNYNINFDEVAEVIEVPLSQLLDSSNIKSKVFYTSSSGIDRTAPYYDVMGLEIWGATAMMLSELLEVIKKL